MNENFTVVLKLHRKYINNKVVVGYLTVGDDYLCDTIEKRSHTLPTGVYTLKLSGEEWYSMQWDIVEGVSDWFKENCNSNPRIRTQKNDYDTFGINEVMPDSEGIIDLGYMYGMLSCDMWWRGGKFDIMREFVRMIPEGVSVDILKFKLQIL